MEGLICLVNAPATKGCQDTRRQSIVLQDTMVHHGATAAAH
jgi:hypothetical protein